jgi:hypothetical protein
MRGHRRAVPTAARLYAAGAGLALFLAAAPALAQAPAATPTPVPPGTGGAGDLLVAPTRIVLEARTRSAEITLVNIGREPATYRVTLLHLAMTEAGELKEIEKPEPGAPFADDLVRFSPRQVTLAPNASQIVRLQLRLPADLPAGEYRSHLLFRAIPKEDVAPERRIESKGEAKPGELSVQLIPIYGVSIPLIVRHAPTSATAGLTDLALEPAPAAGKEGPALRCRLTRAGNQSVYGNITVTFRPAQGAAHVVGTLNGVAVYPPLAARSVRIPLQAPPGVSLSGGRLEVAFSKPEQNGERLADASVAIP